MTLRRALVLAFISGAFFAATAPSVASSPAQAGPSPALTVKDDLGRTVAVPAAVKRIVSLQAEITRLVVALGAGGELAGIDYTMRRHDHLFKYIYPDEARLPVVSMAENNVNLETLVSLKPDIIFASPFEKQIVEAIQRKTKIPVVALASLGDTAKLADELKLVGRILARERRAEELAAYFSGGLGRVRDRLKDVPAGRKPRVYMSFWGSLTRTPIRYDPVAIAGGLNLAEKAVPDVLGSAGTTVNVERIIAWNPDVILVHGNYLPAERTVTVEGILGDSRFASLKAVKSRKVRYTFGFWNWWDMAEVLLETEYLAALFYPERFPAFDLGRRCDEIHKMFYGLDGGFAKLSAALGCDEWTHD